MNKCEQCKGTGVALAIGVTAADTVINRCDECKERTDQEAVELIERLLAQYAKKRHKSK